MHSSLRIFKRTFRRRALGVGPGTPWHHKLVRSVRYAMWYSPLTQWALRRYDRLRPAAPVPVPPFDADGPLADLVTTEGTLRDASRGVRLDYSIVRPAAPDRPMPVVVYSIPMVWGARHSSPPINYIAEYLARSGYCVVRVRHTDTDRIIFPHDVDDAADPYAYISDNMRDPGRISERFRDIPFVLDRIAEWNHGPGPLTGQLDLDRIGLCGHSFGCKTMFAVLGETIGPDKLSFADSRIRAGIAYSITPAIDPGASSAAYAAVHTPVLHIAGSRDISWSEPSLPEDRLWAYHKIDAPDQYRLMLYGADHLRFPGGRADRGIAGPAEQRNLHFLKAVSLAFWDAYLRDDAGARDWLRQSFPGLLNKYGDFDWK